MTKDKAKKIVDAIFLELGGRGGIGDQLDLIHDDNEVYEEMYDACVARVISSVFAGSEPNPSIRYNDDSECWEGLPHVTTVTDSFTMLAIDNGMRILSFGGRRKAGEDVHVIGSDGKSVQHWSHKEWEEDGEVVMGAILRAAGGVEDGKNGEENES
jgi:hypothetical protein